MLELLPPPCRSPARVADPGALDAIVREHGRRMIAVARRICRNDADARDAVQAGYLNALRSLETFEGEACLSTWLHRIVVIAALMRVRARKRKGEEPLDLRPASRTAVTSGRLASRLPGPDEILASRERRAAVRTCIDALPDAYRSVLLLRDIQEVSTPETARRLNLTPTAVKVRLHRARKALTARLRADFGPLTQAAV